MKDSVTLHGALSHPATRALLGTADLFVLPSFAEGVPVALMEAMSMRVACISTFVAGIPELIEPGTQGLLVPPSSQTHLTEAMTSLIEDPSRRMALATAGREKVLSSYDLYTNIGKLTAVFERHGLRGGGMESRALEVAS
jgi:glycosyltransferase involved in cell wall biosynthesis